MIGYRETQDALFDAGVPATAPGEFFAQLVLPIKGHNVGQAADEMRISTWVLEELMYGRMAVDASFADKLADYTGNSAQFWLNMQATYDVAHPSTGNVSGGFGMGAA